MLSPVELLPVSRGRRGGGRDCRREFARRKSLMWRAAFPWIFLGIAGAVITATIGEVDDESDGVEWIVMLLAMAGFVGGIAGWIKTAKKHLRCPNCGVVPRGEENAIDLNPAVCHNCDARLS